MKTNFIRYKSSKLLIGFLCLIYSGKNVGQSNSTQPNIILIMADDLGYETLGCNGGESYKTPNLDKLAKEGIRFTQTYAMPLCTPSRVQLMTGKHNYKNYERFGYLNPKEKTFANYLHENGYRTAVAGKWQLEGDKETPGKFGFDEYMLWQLEKGDFWRRYKAPKIIHNGKELDFPADSSVYGPDIFTDFITDFIDRPEKKPFFVYYPMALVHDPFQPAPSSSLYRKCDALSTNDTQHFSSMVSYMDGLIGKIYNHLKAINELENSVIIFTGDNGTDRRITSRFKGRDVKGGKGFATYYGTHVPLIVYGKDRFLKGAKNNNLIDFTDILPTILELGGLEVPETMKIDGISFCSQLTGDFSNTRKVTFSDYNPKGRDFPSARYAQTQKYKLYNDERFYDIHLDPEEKNPLEKDRLSLIDKKAFNFLKIKLKQFNSQIEDYGKLE